MKKRLYWITYAAFVSGISTYMAWKVELISTPTVFLTAAIVLALVFVDHLVMRNLHGHRKHRTRRA